ncbi:MAG TPA: LacI family DNA-binding transcriptional regulator [Streptosporangiaceae bacterium]
MSKPRRPTIADVAAASGVGVGTVSRVINGAAGVRAATRARVLAAIERLGYRPSHLAAALARGTPRTIAIVIPHLTRPSAAERLAGALAVLTRHEYDTIVCNADSPAQRDHVLTMLAARHRADGVLVMSLSLSRAQLAAFRKAGLPLAAVDVAVRGVPHTIIDDVDGGRLATNHLLSLGHRRIGFIGDRVPQAVASGSPAAGRTASARRLAGYRQALAAAGEHADDALIRLGPHGPASAQALAAELLAQPDPPSAIFAASDTQAMGVLAAADRYGARVPRQLSVIGFDDIQPAALLGLSTVRQPLERSGAEGAERLCALLRGERVRPLRQVLEVQVVPRASSGRPGTRPHGPSPAARPAPPDGAAAAARRPGEPAGAEAAGTADGGASRAPADSAGPADGSEGSAEGGPGKRAAWAGGRS